MLCHVLHTSSWKHPLCSARAASEVNSVGLEIREYKKRRRSGARLQSATMQISVSPPGRERSPLPPEVSLLCPLKVWQLIRFYSQPCVRKRLQVTELFFFFYSAAENLHTRREIPLKTRPGLYRRRHNICMKVFPIIHSPALLHSASLACLPALIL